MNIAVYHKLNYAGTIMNFSPMDVHSVRVDHCREYFIEHHLLRTPQDSQLEFIERSRKSNRFVKCSVRPRCRFVGGLPFVEQRAVSPRIYRPVAGNIGDSEKIFSQIQRIDEIGFTPRPFTFDVHFVCADSFFPLRSGMVIIESERRVSKISFKSIRALCPA